MAQNPNQKGNKVQLQSLYRERIADGSFLQFPEFTGRAQILSANYSSCVQDRGTLKSTVGWQTICIHALETWRQNVFGDAVMAPLEQNVILNNAKAAVSAGVGFAGTRVTAATPLGSSRYSQLQAEVTFTDQTSTQRVIQFDIGGGVTFSFCGSHAGIDILFPQPAIVVPVNGNAAQLAQVVVASALAPVNPGVILDTLVEASYAVSPAAPMGRRVLRHTTTRIVTNPNPMLFKVPAGAVEVFVYSSVSIAADVLTWLDGGIAGGPLSVGVLPAAMMAASGAPALVPGTARWLSVAVPAATENITVVFTLEY